MDNIFTDLFNNFAQYLQNILPLSPFAPYISELSQMPFLGWLNWFLPVHDLLVIFGAWLASVTVFYLYGVVLRWLKVVQG